MRYNLLHFSLFILLKGVSKETAFRIGKEIVDEVTALNSKPVKLKFEKVGKVHIDSYQVLRDFECINIIPFLFLL